MTQIIPLHNNVVVEEFELGEVTKGNILIPQIAKASTPYRYAKVIATGPGRYAADGHLVPVSVKAGDIVAFAKNQGYEFPLADNAGTEQVFRMINEQYLMGVVIGMPEQSRLTGLDGRLLTMAPGSRAVSDHAYAHLDTVDRARRSGIIDSQGDTLATMDALDAADEQGD